MAHTGLDQTDMNTNQVSLKEYEKSKQHINNKAFYEILKPFVHTKHVCKNENYLTYNRTNPEL